jgi:hypothetical protein
VRRRRPTRGSSYLVPVLAWAGALGWLCVIAASAGHEPFSTATWAHWDAAHYLAIARHGYSNFHACGAGRWCGDAAWLPAYPAAGAALHGLGLPLAGAMLAVSWAFALGALVLLWDTFLRDLPRARAVAGLAFAAWTPGQIYHFALFPLSMLFFFTVAYLRFLSRRQWLRAGVAAAAAVACYPLGVALVAVGTLWIVLSVPRDRLRATALAAAPSLVAFAAILTLQRAQTGRWTAFFDVQRSYGHGVHDPLGVTWNAVLLLERAPHLFVRQNAPAAQIVFSALVVAAVVVWLVLGRRRRTEIDLLLVLWAVVTWAFPLALAHVSHWRSEAALAPLGVLVARLATAAWLPIIAVAAFLSVPMAWLYFANALI